MTPRIACLGWGSLVWDPQDLPLNSEWQTDGCDVPVEFLRQSKEGHVTLVLDASAAPLHSLWALMNVSEITTAVIALRRRERIREKLEGHSVGRWQRGDPPPRLIPALPRWAGTVGVDAVVWTALRRQFGKLNRPATAAEIVDYLGHLTGPVRELAEQYVRRAPPQIKTAYRTTIEEKLGWKHPA